MSGHYSPRLASIRGRGHLGERLTPDLARHAADGRDASRPLTEPAGTRSGAACHFPPVAGRDLSPATT